VSGFPVLGAGSHMSTGSFRLWKCWREQDPFTPDRPPQGTRNTPDQGASDSISMTRAKGPTLDGLVLFAVVQDVPTQRLV